MPILGFHLVVDRRTHRVHVLTPAQFHRLFDNEDPRNWVF